jgi:hypothetical protein
VFWKSFDEVIKTQPETPTVMVERDREDKGDYKQNYKDSLIIRTNYRQPDSAGYEDQEFSGNYVGQNGSHEKPLFAFKDRATDRAVMSYSKGSVDYARLSARRT